MSNLHYFVMNKFEEMGVNGSEQNSIDERRLQLHTGDGGWLRQNPPKRSSAEKGTYQMAA